MQDLELRSLVMADMAAVARVHRTSYNERLPWLAGRYTLEQHRMFFRERVFPTCQIVGGFVGRHLAGFIAFREGWLDQFYVLPEMQARGIGTALLGEAQSQCAQLQLAVFQRNTAARSYYEKRGFHLVRETNGAENDEHEPAAIYEWRRLGPAYPHRSA